jgi:hypothetical protein
VNNAVIPCRFDPLSPPWIIKLFATSILTLGAEEFAQLDGAVMPAERGAENNYFLAHAP